MHIMAAWGTCTPCKYLSHTCVEILKIDTEVERKGVGIMTETPKLIEMHIISVLCPFHSVLFVFKGKYAHFSHKWHIILIFNFNNCTCND